ncbi:uncharacterized protein LOC123712251 [Pieris brassicae]|uniref:Uncharacterized protein n=1 Tax=Pieris brassicae TaxID=7116 RepID=A0A9P0X6N6_PIEBR|nr:uncharacterized protein LOC123712251 [Pieris brassicae]CAH4001595.1 unnamed protein product [Pieris brassicae]
MFKWNYLIYIILSILVTLYFTEGYEDHTYTLLSSDQHAETPRLEDFFWTGSGDGPPPPDLSAPAPVPSSPIVRTTTVLATVYLDSYPPQAVTDKTGECVVNCESPEGLEPEIPEDRRYWLLTVIQGSTPDSLQLRLARLYQKAFLRQQEKHLGIIKSLDATTARKKHDVHSFIVNKNNEISPINDIHSSMINIDMQSVSTIDKEMFLANSMESLISEIEPTRVEDIAWVLVTPTMVIRKRDTREAEEIDMNREDIEPLEESNNETILFKREIIKPEQQPPVQVHIQNITESAETGSVQIVYVVLVGGRAVPAAVAARDMRLVRDAEVAKELGAVVTTKAEPAYLRAAEGLEGEAPTTIHGTELWALAVGSTIAVLLLIIILVLLCLAHRKKSIKSSASLRAYRNELMQEIEKNRAYVREDNNGKLVSVVSPSRTRPSSALLPIYRKGSASSSSTTSSSVSDIVALRRRQKKPHALRMPQKKRVGTTDSLLEAAGIESSDSGQPSAPQTPTSYLSMPSVTTFPRGNIVEPLSRILEPISVRHLDIDSPIPSPKGLKDTVPRRQMPSQLVRLGSIDKDPGVIGPLVWDLHCQRIKDASKPSSPMKSLTRKEPSSSRMRQRFNELMDDAFTLFGTPTPETCTIERESSKDKSEPVSEARNDNVRVPCTVDTVRGRSAGPGRSGTPIDSIRPRTSFVRTANERRVPTRAWGPTPPQSVTRIPATPIVNTALMSTKGKLSLDDPALPLISAIKSEIQRVRENASKQN